MLFEVLRFNHRACLVLSPSYAYPSDSISDYINRNQYSLAFQNGYLIPLVSSLWVHDPDQTLNSIPMVMLIGYLHNHRILNSFGKSLEWLVLEQAAKQYVDAILADIPFERLHKSTPIINVSSSEGGKLALRLENRNVEYFDHVIMAIHAPDALNILGQDATPLERAILAAFRTSSNTTVLHSDISVRISFSSQSHDTHDCQTAYENIVHAPQPQSMVCV